MSLSAILRSSMAIIGIAVALLLPAGAQAQPYPNRPVTLVVGQGPGGPSDIIARIFTQGLTSKLGTVIIENAGAAGGTVAAARVARAKPDGYTLLFGTSGINAIAYGLYSNLQYAPDDLAPIAYVADSWILVAAGNKLGVKSLEEFVALAKAKPKGITIGHTGKGQTTHLVCLLLERAAGVQLEMIPYRSGADEMNALLGGFIDGACAGAVAVGPVIQAGQAVGLAVGGPRRIKSLPDTPSAVDVGYPGLAAPVWFVIFAPKGTPPDVIKTLNEAFADVAADPKVNDALMKLGSSVSPEDSRSIDATEKFVSGEIKRWTDVFEHAGIAKE